MGAFVHLIEREYQGQIRQRPPPVVPPRRLTQPASSLADNWEMQRQPGVTYHPFTMRSRAGWGWGFLFVLACCLAGCTKANPSATCADGLCSDAQFPFCDVNGAIDGEPNSCISVSCIPSEFATCDGDNAITCNASGDNYDVGGCNHGCSANNNGCNECTAGDTQCGDGVVQTCGEDGRWATSDTCASSCSSTPIAHCAYISPRYLPDICDSPAPPDTFDVSQSGTLDTDLNINCNGGIVAQASGPAICVVRHKVISIEHDAELTVGSSANQNGTGGRALAFVADNAVTIDGVVNVGAAGSTSGPGGGTVSSGQTTDLTVGKGGAGFKTPGGAGGTSTIDGGANDGGDQAQDPALLTVLLGGPGNVGGGGGALTIIACRGTVLVSGTIDAHGGGGTGAFHFGSPTPFPGGGGGAGGYVVLQGVSVMVTGQVYANGGGGGAGGLTNVDGTPSQNGLDGFRSDTVAATGGTPQSGAGGGGDGGVKGAVAKNPGSGKHPTASGDTPGGGGGSVGFFQSYTPAGVTPTLTPSHASPAFQPNATIPTR